MAQLLLQVDVPAREAIIRVLELLGIDMDTGIPGAIPVPSLMPWTTNYQGFGLSLFEWNHVPVQRKRSMCT